MFHCFSFRPSHVLNVFFTFLHICQFSSLSVSMQLLQCDVVLIHCAMNVAPLPVECHDLPCGIPRKNEFWSSCRLGNRDVCPSGVRRLGKWDIIGFRVERHELPSELARKSDSARGNPFCLSPSVVPDPFMPEPSHSARAIPCPMQSILPEPIHSTRGNPFCPIHARANPFCLSHSVLPGPCCLSQSILLEPIGLPIHSA